MNTQANTWGWKDAEQLYNNYYQCPHCDVEWHFLSDSQTADDCPECGLHAIEPVQTDIL